MGWVQHSSSKGHVCSVSKCDLYVEMRDQGGNVSPLMRKCDHKITRFILTTISLLCVLVRRLHRQ